MKRFASVAALVAACGAFAAPAVAADQQAKRGGDAARGISAEHPCSPTFYDSDEQEWDVEGAYGSVFNGSDDAYDEYGYAYIETRNGSEYGEYYNGGRECDWEEDGRELVLPFQSLQGSEFLRGGLPPVEMQRKIYVPSTGLPFARFLNVLRNTSDQPVTVDYGWYGWYGCPDRVYSAEEPFDIGERAIYVEHCDGGTNVVSVFAGPVGRTWNDMYSGPETDIDRGGSMLDIVWRGVTIPAGGTVSFMHIEHQTSDGEAFRTPAIEGSEEFFTGLTPEERASIVNWNREVIDTDGDGIEDGDDNCAAVANADQADLDGDRQGDACDDDVDGDGLSAAVEAGLGTNPRSGDSDGDGRPDGADLCPTLAGPGAGCPAPTATTTTLASRSLALPTDVTLNVTARRGSTKKRGKARAAQSSGVTVRSTGRIQPPRGLSASACADGRIAVVIKRGKRTISSRVVEVEDDCTYRSSVQFNRRLGKSVRVKSYFFGSRGLSGRAAKSKTATIK